MKGMYIVYMITFSIIWMSLFKTNICTVVFDGSKYSYFCGVIDGEKESYINKYCNVLYNFFQQMYK